MKKINRVKRLSEVGEIEKRRSNDKPLARPSVQELLEKRFYIDRDQALTSKLKASTNLSAKEISKIVKKHFQYKN